MSDPEHSANNFLDCFKLVCRKCGSENVVFSTTESWGSDSMGQWPGTIIFGCNECKQNDYELST